MLEAAGNFGNEGTLYLLQRFGYERILKSLQETVWCRLHLLIKLFTKIDIQIQIL